MRRSLILLILFLLLVVTLPVPGAVAADPTKDLHLAARSGDLQQVKRLIEAGTDVDAADQWGTTALSLAAKTGEVEVVRYLLKRGANPDAEESFFGMSVLDVALWKGDPEGAIVRLLLDAGASGRAQVLAEAIDSDDLELARAAVKAGPVLESEAQELHRRYPAAKDEFGKLLAGLKTIPDPPPPSYSAEELARFTGRFEGGEAHARVRVHKQGLELELDGKKVALRPAAERVFRDSDGETRVSYFGRAGTVEGLRIAREGQPPLRMRLGEEPLATVTRAAPAAEETTRKTVHWPGFRGDNRDGIGDGVDTPVDFDLADGRGVAWVAELPGLGNSSPVVWGDRVYVTTAVAEGGSTPLKTGLTGAGDEVEENTEHRWLLLAFDKKSGKKLWETEVGRGVPLTRRHFKATQANSTPITDGKHVVVVFPTAGLACIDANDGKLHWKHELGGLNAGGFNDPGMQWGFAASPILHDGKVILQVDIHEGAYLAAWELASGKPLWKTPRPDVAPSWSTPAIWSTDKGDELIVNASIIRGYDPRDGSELWRLGPTSIQVVASPVVGPEHLFVSSGYPPARPIYAVKPGIRGTHTIESDDDAGSLAWYQTRGGAYMPTPLLYRGLLYVVHHNARLVAHDAATGQPVHRARLSAGGTCTSSPVAANGKIYQGTEEGTLYVLEAGGEHRELAVHEFDEPLMATPAISEGMLLIRTPLRLIALRKSSKSAD